jgi:hypothetical protein
LNQNKSCSYAKKYTTIACDQLKKVRAAWNLSVLFNTSYWCKNSINARAKLKNAVKIFLQKRPVNLDTTSIADLSTHVS